MTLLVAEIALFFLPLCTFTHALSSSGSSSTIRIGSRPSNLALIQAKMIQQLLHDAIQTNDSTSLIQTEIVPIDSSGDISSSIAASQDVPLAMKAVDFTGSLDDALGDGIIDVAVHSLKDIPPANRWKEGLLIGAYSNREDPLDVLISDRCKTLADLPKGARVGSASIRRQAQLLSHRPDVTVVNIRGNVQARIAALERGDVDALILAAAGLERLAKSESGGNIISAPYKYNKISADEMLPGAGQGIIATACRRSSDDDNILSLLKQIDNPSSRVAAVAERAFLDVIDTMKHEWAGRPPVAAYMSQDDHGWTFRGLLLTPDGMKKVRTLQRLPQECSAGDAFTLGTRVGYDLREKAGDSFYTEAT